MLTFLRRGEVDMFSVCPSRCLFALQCSEYQWTANMYSLVVGHEDFLLLVVLESNIDIVFFFLKLN